MAGKKNSTYASIAFFVALYTCQALRARFNLGKVEINKKSVKTDFLSQPKTHFLAGGNSFCCSSQSALISVSCGRDQVRRYLLTFYHH
jgi:hypothetical protein